MQRAFERLAACGGAVLEPWMDRVADVSAQLQIAEDGTVTVLGTLRIVTTGAGQPRGHRGELDAEGQASTGLGEEEALREAAGLAGVHAAAAGYNGPCGIDAFAFRSPEDGVRRFRPLVEFNARFTAGTVALGHLRRNLPHVQAELGLAPGVPSHFYIGLAAANHLPATREGALVVPLLGERGRLAGAPVLVVARKREVVDEWLGASEDSE
jgi:hypothetical protein